MVPSPRIIDTSSQPIYHSKARSPKKQDVEVIDLTGSLASNSVPKYGTKIIQRGSGSQSASSSSSVIVVAGRQLGSDTQCNDCVSSSRSPTLFPNFPISGPHLIDDRHSRSRPSVDSQVSGKNGARYFAQSPNGLTKVDGQKSSAESHRHKVDAPRLFDTVLRPQTTNGLIPRRQDSSTNSSPSTYRGEHSGSKTYPFYHSTPSTYRSEQSGSKTYPVYPHGIIPLVVSDESDLSNSEEALTNSRKVNESIGISCHVESQKSPVKPILRAAILRDLRDRIQSKPSEKDLRSCASDTAVASSKLPQRVNPDTIPSTPIDSVTTGAVNTLSNTSISSPTTNLASGLRNDMKFDSPQELRTGQATSNHDVNSKLLIACQIPAKDTADGCKAVLSGFGNKTQRNNPVEATDPLKHKSTSSVLEEGNDSIMSNLSQKASDSKLLEPRIMIISIQAYEANLRGHLTQLRKDQTYFVGNKLKQAREGKQMGSVIVPYSISPFDSVNSIRCDNSNKQNVGKFGHFVRGTNERSNALYSYSITTYKQEHQPVPPYTAYISAKRNVLTEDDKQRTFLPYHGDDFEVDDTDKEYAALETKIEENKARYHRLNRLHDKADLYRHYAETFLAEIGGSFEVVLHYLLDETPREAPLTLPEEYKPYWNLRTSYLGDGYYEEQDDQYAKEEQGTLYQKKPRRQWQQLRQQLVAVEEHKLAIACVACKVFQDIAGFSLFHIVQVFTPNPAALPSLFSLGTYLELGCFICKAHECPGHGEYHDSEENKNSRERVNFKPGSPDPEVKPIYKLNEVNVADFLGLRDDGDVVGPAWTSFRNSSAIGLEDTDLCSDDCFWVKQARVLELSDWSQADKEAFTMLRPAFEYETRGPCLIAQCGMIKQSCKEIFLKLLLDPSTYTVHSLKIRNEKEVTQHTLPPRRTIDQWFDDPDSDRAWRQDTREPFLPCDHLGPCSKDTGCSCYAEGVHCEKSCGCFDGCTRKFQGCRCHSRGRPCRTDRCDCRRLNRECDPDICTTCGSDEVLDLLNRHDEEIVAGKCENVYIQRGVPKRTLLAPSKLMADGGKSGWGLYMGEECKKGDFIGEYRGEIISDAEADQRGTIYDKRNMSYLFTLNGVQTLDSTLIGNKLRFINHQADPMANCYARLLLCHGVVRIGMFAQKDIAISEEMFFNYGESFATKFDLIKMNPDGSVTVERPQKHSRPMETFKRRVNDSRPPEYQPKNKARKNGHRVGRPRKGLKDDMISSPAPESSQVSTSRKRRRSDTSEEQAIVLGCIEVKQPPKLEEESQHKRLRRISPQLGTDDSDSGIRRRRRQTRSQIVKASTVSQSPASAPSKRKPLEPNARVEHELNTRSNRRSKATPTANVRERPIFDMPSETEAKDDDQDFSSGQEPSEDEEEAGEEGKEEQDSSEEGEEEEEEEEEDTTPRRSSRRRSEKHHFEESAISPSMPTRARRHPAIERTR